MNYATILLEEEGPVAVVKVNRPDVLNSLNRQVLSELISVFDEIEKRLIPKVVFRRCGLYATGRESTSRSRQIFSASGSSQNSEPCRSREKSYAFSNIERLAFLQSHRR